MDQANSYEAWELATISTWLCTVLIIMASCPPVKSQSRTAPVPTNLSGWQVGWNGLPGMRQHIFVMLCPA